MAANTAQGSGQLYDWGDGHGRVHSRPKKSQAPAPNSIYGKPIWGGMGQMGKPGTAPGYAGPGSGAPQPSAAPAPPIQPPDPAYQAWLAQQQLNLGLSGAEATYQRGNLGYETGYNAAGQRDFTNPYNAATEYENQFKRSRLGTTNSMAAAGQLHSGAYGRAQNENARNLSMNLSDLQHQAASGYHGIDVGQATNAIQYGAGTQDQSLAALLRALGVGS